MEARLEPFRSFEIVGATPRSDEVDIVVRLFLQVAELRGGHASPEPVGAHGHPGRIDGDRFVHSHRFQLQREGRAWRIYQFAAVDGPP